MKHFFCLLLGFLSWQFAHAQQNSVTVSGTLKDARQKTALPFVNVTLCKVQDSAFLTGTITNETGHFTISAISSGQYLVKCSYMGYNVRWIALTVGQLSNFLDIGQIELTPATVHIQEVTVTGKQDAVTDKMDKKTFSLTANISQAGGSVMDAMRNLPGITSQDGKVLLRGSDKVMILMDGKQTALTGMGGQSSLENIPASAIEKIEIIHNPSARYDANGNAGIINIIYKKEKKDGFNGKIGLITGLGALWERKANLPDIRPQYSATPKINPSLLLNYRKNKVNLFFQGDNLYTRTLNKNEYTERLYDNGEPIQQQLKRNRTTNIITGKAGMDWKPDEQNTITVSGLFSSEKILDRGDEPFFTSDLKERKQLWQFLEDELKTTATVSAGWQHQFRHPGRTLQLQFNYTFHREDEKYFFTNIMPTYTGLDSFKLLSDEHVMDLNADYIHPLKYGRFEGGIKLRRRDIPTNMQFKPGLHSPLDTSAGGWANYREFIPAAYGVYVFESNHLEIEAGLRIEYVDLRYDVNPGHNTYKSNGYNYMQPFPNLRLSYRINDQHKLSFFYNRRVDRPNEVDIRIFPKYDDAAIIKVGNPELRPQFTNTFELGYKSSWRNGFFNPSVYHKRMDATITRIGSIVNGSNLIYNVFQNAGKSYNTGIEINLTQKVGRRATFNLNLNGYQNTIAAFTVVNKYPQTSVYSADRQELFSGNIKFNGLFQLPRQVTIQLTGIYLAPDIIPQGKIAARFSVDLGIKKTIGNHEFFFNATDIANTLRIKREITGNGFSYTSTDYAETQVIRLGYGYKF
ncbi:TonB-dependent receptor domain-containing protein [Chitinophaga nivalis]|uniref:TonB-dependent receptor n=1 Tax=Chitinophaga nivalis TaxID=2991709 RepID=A0ABT3IQ42_9BACT|nr:TonB-dependent receptor [Chitinophaga nivalis]MCW3464230.1 TonB-dependent receptor [Chitinophaga nivalis]MCW3486080.1 TonB-dependent receptor [Chitinophaga nivalis]